MPIYEYRRPDGTTFDMQQSFSDEPLTVDPDTGVPVERVLHPPAVHFKGKGFYNTDYGTRNRQRETAAAAEGSPSGDSAKDSSAKDSSSSGGASSGSSGGESTAGGKGEKASSNSSKTKPAKPAAGQTG
ncbi:MAG TPA: zinc ribbon domain-containing protein [Solirubrobacteraceae bacterium]|jgi:predicted nucleic acid-binding Zn ribbon protein